MNESWQRAGSPVDKKLSTMRGVAFTGCKYSKVYNYIANKYCIGRFTQSLGICVATQMSDDVVPKLLTQFMTQHVEW